MKPLWALAILAGVVIVLAASEVRRLKVGQGVGEAAPPIELSTIDGEPFSLAQFKGRPVLVHFWASFCGTCIEELPSLERLHRDMAKGDLVLVTISEDGPGALQKVRSLAQRMGISFPVLVDPHGSVADDYRSFGVPETFFIDRGGVISGRIDNAVDWDGPDARAKVIALIEGR